MYQDVPIKIFVYYLFFINNMNYGFVLALLFINCLNSGLVDGQDVSFLKAMKKMCAATPISNQHVKMCQQGVHLPGGAFYADVGLTFRCFCIKTGMAGQHYGQVRFSPKVRPLAIAP